MAAGGWAAARAAATVVATVAATPAVAHRGMVAEATAVVMAALRAMAVGTVAAGMAEDRAVEKVVDRATGTWDSVARRAAAWRAAASAYP